jgi:hypothetical protein
VSAGFTVPDGRANLLEELTVEPEPFVRQLHDALAHLRELPFRHDHPLIERQAATELGHWSTRAEIAGQDGGPIEVSDARELLAGLLARIAERSPRRPMPDPDGRGA